MVAKVRTMVRLRKSKVKERIYLILSFWFASFLLANTYDVSRRINRFGNKMIS